MALFRGAHRCVQNPVVLGLGLSLVLEVVVLVFVQVQSLRLSLGLRVWVMTTSLLKIALMCRFGGIARVAISRQ